MFVYPVYHVFTYNEDTADSKQVSISQVKTTVQMNSVGPFEGIHGTN